jgi:hypothetical protein
MSEIVENSTADAALDEAEATLNQLAHVFFPDPSATVQSGGPLPDLEAR